MVAAPALSSAIAMGLAITLAWKFRKHIEWNICLFPTGVFGVQCGGNQLCKRHQSEISNIGIWNIFGHIGVYFLIISERMPFQANWKTASICAAVLGITSGLFGIGGPLMAIYFVSATKGKESYLGSIQFLFAVTNAVNLLTRVVNGIYTLDLFPMTVLGFLCITAGKKIGLRILTMLNPNKTKKMVYTFVGISGVITTFQHL